MLDIILVVNTGDSIFEAKLFSVSEFEVVFFENMKIYSSKEIVVL